MEDTCWAGNYAGGEGDSVLSWAWGGEGGVRISI